MDSYSTLTNDLRAACPGLELRENEPMARHTTFRVGGPVRLMALPKSGTEAAAAVKAARALGITPFFMGNGSNLLAADRGWEGFIIKTQTGLDALEADGSAITAGSGVLLVRLSLIHI